MTVSNLIKLDSLIQIIQQKTAKFRGLRLRQNVGANILGSDGVGFFLFVVFALIVAADRHGKAEPDQKTQQSQNGAYDEVEVLLALLQRMKLPAQENANPR